MHVTPITRDEQIARAWFERFEGAGLDGLIAKRADLAYQPDKRVMTKIKHVRTADCVVAGYRVHKSAPDAIGSLLLGLHVDEAAPASQWHGPHARAGARRRDRRVPARAPARAVRRAPAPRGRRRRPPVELGGRAGHGRPRAAAAGTPSKDLSFVPLRPERVVEVRYDYLEGARFRHPPQFLRWRPDRDPASCGYAQLEQPTPFDLADVLAGRLEGGAQTRP